MNASEKNKQKNETQAKKNPFIRFIGFFINPSIIPFMIVGAVNTVISMGGSFALREYAHWGLLPATSLMFAITSVPGFYFNRKYSFKSNAPLGKSIIRFATIITCCFILSFTLNNLFMPWAREHWLANVSGTIYNLITIVGIQVVFTALNYTGQRLWAFKPAEAE